MPVRVEPELAVTAYCTFPLPFPLDFDSLIQDTLDLADHFTLAVTPSSFPLAASLVKVRLDAPSTSLVFLCCVIVHVAFLPLALTVILPVRSLDPVFAVTSYTKLPDPLPLDRVIRIHDTLEEAVHGTFAVTFSAIAVTPEAGCLRLVTAVCSLTSSLACVILHFTDLPLVLTVIVPVRALEPVFSDTL